MSTESIDLRRPLAHPGSRVHWLLFGLGVLAAVLGGTMSLTALLWNDSLMFISSAIDTVRTSGLELRGGRNPGYVIVLASVLESHAGLDKLMLVQQALWCLTCGLFAACAATLLPWRYASVTVLVCFYPGLQLFQNLVLAESLYASSVTTALCFALLACRFRNGFAQLAFACVALTLASCAGLLKSQGAAVWVAIVFLACWLGWRSRATFVVAGLVISVGLSGAVLFAGFRAQSSSTDPATAVFGAKTLFCIHLDLVLDSPGTRLLAEQAFNSNAARFMDLLHADLTKQGEFQTLGFNADKCQFDGELDRIGLETSSSGAQGLARWYARAFKAAVLANPLAYASKVARQLAYGLKMSLPPLALSRVYESATGQPAAVRELLERAGFGASASTADDASIEAPLTARLDGPTHWALRLASLPVSLALIVALVGLISRRWRAHPLAACAAACALVWWAQIASVALTHTLDVWRYIVPVVPAAVLSFLLVLRIALTFPKRPSA